MLRRDTCQGYTQGPVTNNEEAAHLILPTLSSGFSNKLYGYLARHRN
ncbi:hypothetical protein OIU77_017713 [Salix suchowensis]|uniref:Uncharacterized protein n=1 Tax=Salix suchowensis TaxID=1278906 RepID=A0ABQ8ZPR3_9ROSI|nr:hypothetical protein OIU77_017713 [Salix suchowensis]